jgi:hypothetical protein
MLIVQPLRSLGRKVKVPLGGRNVLEAWKTTRSRPDKAVIVALLPKLTVASQHAVFARESTCLARKQYDESHEDLPLTYRKLGDREIRQYTQEQFVAEV